MNAFSLRDILHQKRYAQYLIASVTFAPLKSIAQVVTILELFFHSQRFRATYGAKK
jgi:hypothetical protein